MSSKGKDKISSSVPSNKMQRIVLPLASLNQYQANWTIKVFVADKQLMRTYKNARGEGCLFSVELADADGTRIQATMFNEAAKKFFPMFELGKVYYISRGTLKVAKKQFATVDNDYEMTLNQYSHVEEAINETMLVPERNFSFVSIDQLGRYVNTMELVDVIGVVQHVSPTIRVKRKSNNDIIPKRDITIVDASLRMSPLWSSIKILRLTINMRARADPWFSDFLLRVGNGVEESEEEHFIRIPDDMAIPYDDEGTSKNSLIDAIFPSLQVNGTDSDYIISRAILTPKNENVDDINDQLIDRFCGEEKVYYSFDEAEDDKNNFYPMEFLNSLTVGGLPPHYLRLKVGCPIILLRNVDPSNGLCNGTRLICRGFQHNVIDAEIAVGQHAGTRVFLPRIPLSPSDDDIFPFKLKRKQFPVRLSFSMTINKAQGQTIPHVGVYLPEPVFSHGQLYVALSRGISRATTKVLVKPTKKFDGFGVYTSNVVYQEVLND